MKKWGEQPELHFDEKEMRADLGSGNYIFVGSSCDMFAVNGWWIARVLDHCNRYSNTYLFQSKDPFRAWCFEHLFPKEYIFCTTLESNRFYFSDWEASYQVSHFRSKFLIHAWLRSLKSTNVPSITERAEGIKKFARRHITIEPIIDFDLEEFVELLRDISPEQINIGADSGRNNLPEPSAEKVRTLIAELEKFTKVVQKKNLSRILRGER